MKFIRKHTCVYFYSNGKPKTFSGDLFEDQEHGFVIRMKRKKQCVRKDTLFLTALAPQDGTELWALLRDNPHPNIMRVLDFDNDFVYAEYIDGKMLYDPYICEGKEYYKGYAGFDFHLPGAKYSSSLVDQIVSAVRHLHSLNIYWSDSKSNNILVADGKVKLIDFWNSVVASPAEVDYTREFKNLTTLFKGLYSYAT